ncbi:MAG: zincin-like metallopeptidase domain-containing protein [Agitococcus sp.]|nr:zincin-like metallopeptidase domain-containing protein [Agitococcus sp.]
MTKNVARSIGRDHRQELTNRLIERMTEAVAYEKPWLSCSEPPFNPITGTRYRGVNFIATMSRGFADPRWYTFLQLKALQASSTTPLFVRHKEEGTAIFHARKCTFGATKKDSTSITDSDESSSDAASPGTKSFFIHDFCAYVFNGSQIEGLTPYTAYNDEFLGQAEAELLAEAMVQSTGLTLEHRSSTRAYYAPNRDCIQLPLKEQFKSEALYYRTLLHEMGHATGHPSRLARDQTGQMEGAGSLSLEKYAFEELIAELTSYYMGAELGLPYDAQTHDNHAAYLQSWLKSLQGDKNYLFKAAVQAGKAADFQKVILTSYKDSCASPLALLAA